MSKVGGNIHVALGKSKVHQGRHVHEFNMHDVSDGFNTSHVIHRLDFGAQVPIIRSSLQGVSKVRKQILGTLEGNRTTSRHFAYQTSDNTGPEGTLRQKHNRKGPQNSTSTKITTLADQKVPLQSLEQRHLLRSRVLSEPSVPVTTMTISQNQER